MRKIVISALLLLCLLSVTYTVQAQSVTLTLVGFEGNYSKPVISNGILYVSRNDTVCAINAADGLKLWTSVRGNAPDGSGPLGNITSLPVIYGEICYYTTSNNWLIATNITNGRAISLVSINGMQNYTDLQPNTDGNVNSITLIFNTEIKEPYSPTTIDGTTYNVDMNGTIYATGINTWSDNVQNQKFYVSQGSTIYDKIASSTPTPTQSPTTQPTSSPAPTVTSTPEPTTLISMQNIEREAVQGNFSLTPEQTSTVSAATILSIAIVALVGTNYGTNYAQSDGIVMNADKTIVASSKRRCSGGEYN